MLNELPTIENRGEINRVVDFFDSIRSTLIKRARDNVIGYLMKNPAMVRGERERQSQEAALRNKQLHDERIARGRGIALSHMAKDL